MCECIYYLYTCVYISFLYIIHFCTLSLRVDWGDWARSHQNTRALTIKKSRLLFHQVSTAAISRDHKPKYVGGEEEPKHARRGPLLFLGACWRLAAGKLLALGFGLIVHRAMK